MYFASVPQPSVTITGSPGNITFFEGLNLTLVCFIEVHSAVDTTVTVQGNWEVNGTRLQESDDGRISVNNIFMETSSNTFQITAKINKINFDDAGTYGCFASVTQVSNFVIAPKLPAENQRFIIVQGKELLVIVHKCYI